MSSKRMFLFAVALAVISTVLSSGCRRRQDERLGGHNHAPASPSAKTPATADSAKLQPRRCREGAHLTIVEDQGLRRRSPGRQADWSFVIKNTGNADLQIIAARPVLRLRVGQGDQARREDQRSCRHHQLLRPDRQGRHGQSNDLPLPPSSPFMPSSSRSSMPIHWLRPLQHDQGDAETQSRLHSEGRSRSSTSKYRETGSRPQKVDNEADLVKTVGRPGQSQYKVDITVGSPDAKIGPLARIRSTSSPTQAPA